MNRGRTASYPTAPSQIPACGITAPGSSDLLTCALINRYSPQWGLHGWSGLSYPGHVSFASYTDPSPSSPCGRRDKTLLFRKRNMVESTLYVKKKLGTIYGVSGMRSGRKGCEWLQKEGSRCDQLLNWWELQHFWPILDGPIPWIPGFFFLLWGIHFYGIIRIAVQIILIGWDLGICVIYVDVWGRRVSPWRRPLFQLP